MYNKSWLIFVILIVFVTLEVHLTDARRGGSSGVRVRSGTSRSSRSTGSSGSVRTTRFATRRTYFGPSYSPGSWKTAAAVGTLYGLTSYKRRRRYLNSPDSEPTVCFSEQNLRNGSYGYFICPEEGQGDDMAHCCGDEDAQRCCTYTDAENVGRIIGVVIAVLIPCIAIGIIVYCVVVKKKRMCASNKSPCTTTAGMNGMHNTANPTYNAGYPGDEKQEPSPYSQTVDGTNVYATIYDGTSQNPSGPIGFEDGKQPPPQNGVSGPPPYPTTPYTGFQDVPTVPPPAYDASHI